MLLGVSLTVSPCIGSGNDLVPNRWQVITWTNVNQVASLGYNVFPTAT